MSRYEYRAVQVADGEDRHGVYRDGPLYFVYTSLKEARDRRNQIANIPGCKIQEIQRREVGPWKHLERVDG